MLLGIDQHAQHEVQAPGDMQYLLLTAQEEGKHSKYKLCGMPNQRRVHESQHIVIVSPECA
jgi:hypothetical protein